MKFKTVFEGGETSRDCALQNHGSNYIILTPMDEEARDVIDNQYEGNSNVSNVEEYVIYAEDGDEDLDEDELAEKYDMAGYDELVLGVAEKLKNLGVDIRCVDWVYGSEPDGMPKLIGSSN